MPPESVTEPGVVDRVDVDHAAPEPDDCLPPRETPVARADLSPGWVALTDRELLVYHPEREPRVGRTLRANVTGLTVRRAGARRLLGYVPMAGLFAVGGLVVGLSLLWVEPTAFVTLPEGSAVTSFATMVTTLGWAMNMLGAVLVFASILAALAAVVVAGYWLASSDVTLVVERGGGEELECPTTLPAGQRAAETMREELASHASIPSHD